jgi:RNA polymerase sigma-70 factor, ECF subfamily
VATLYDLSDDQLLERARAGDHAAFRVIVLRYEGAVAATVVGMLGAGDEADDVGQETFIRFYRSLGHFRGDSALGTYLRRIAMNLSLNALKRRRRFSLRFSSRDRDRVADTADPASVPDLEAAELNAHVRAAIEQLGPRHRPVVVLRMIEGLSVKETAEILGLPEGTILSRLSRALQQLEPLLARYMEAS